MLCCAAFSVLHAQNFSYAWHNVLNGTPTCRTIESKISGDTLYTLNTFYGDTLDANPFAGQDWIYDSSSVSVSEVVYVSRYTLAGQYLSSEKLIETRTGGIEINDFEIDQNGRFVLIGQSSALTIDFDPTTNMVGSYLYPATGNQLTFIAFYTNAATYVGHIEYPILSVAVGRVYFEDAVIDNSNRMYVAGGFSGTVDFDFTAGTDSIAGGTSTYDAVVLCIDLSAQTYLWGQSFGSGENDFVHYVNVQNSELQLYGRFDGDTIDMDPGAGVVYEFKASGNDEWNFIARWDVNGAHINSMVFGGLNTTVEPGGIVLDAQGNIYVSGNCNAGDTIDVDPGPGVHLLELPSSDGSFLIKYSPNFSLQWARAISSANDVELVWTYERSEISNCSSYILLGAAVYSGELYVTGAGNTDTIMNSDYYGVAFTAFNKASGNIDTIFGMSGDSASYVGSYLQINTMVTDADDHIYVGGSYAGMVDFNHSDAQVVFDTSVTADNINYYDSQYLLKLYAGNFTGITETVEREVISVYPNPSDGEVWVQSTSAVNSLLVLDELGRTIKAIRCNGATRIAVDLSEQAPGVYFFQTTGSDGDLITTRVIKQ